jgi:hypothetical protein
MCCDGDKEGGGMWWVERRRAFEPPLLIADAVEQAVFTVTLLTFSTRAVADGALLLSAWVELILLGHHCLLKDWQYSQAAIQVLLFGCFRIYCVVCRVCVVIGYWVRGHVLS